MYNMQKVRVQFCERVKEEALRWEKRHNYALNGIF
jgi:hypothetical protein